ncbi:spheroidene monooxygenase [Roseivivax sp. GX 12232]|uniref:spheroidene monooxygenase n=1 Tax=Roseivivax sp. GX 12232 TaxID=2900547 RepID=UPI001E29E2EC|nr:spheroidene monooxygenase [Roseivivax sp. GX 12232]MCE0506270.1 spheroidene monooxygenase [Roseivivax sp. GX 12232]
MQSVSLSLFRFDGAAARLWALAMMGGARPMMRKVPGLGFWKLCGSGTGEGFTPLPNTAVYAILGVFDSPRAAQEATLGARPWTRFRAHAAEDWTVYLTPISSRGAWSGSTPFTEVADPGEGPLAALTRATLKPGIAARFWRRVPDISRMIGADPNVLFKIGIGEVPLLHQVTFSVWPDADAMSEFARRSGPHAEAIAAVRRGQWFREELYARFRVAGETGSWEGRSPRLPQSTAPLEAR